MVNLDNVALRVLGNGKNNISSLHRMSSGSRKIFLKMTRVGFWLPHKMQIVHTHRQANVGIH